MPKKKGESISKRTGSNEVVRKKQNNDSYDISEHEVKSRGIFQKVVQIILEKSQKEIKFSIIFSIEIFLQIYQWIKSFFHKG